MLVDCTGTRSLMRDLLLPGADLDVPGRNTQSFHLEHALVITFLYGQHYECNEYCKYYKNLESTGYKFIPAVHRTYYEDGITHVTGIVEHQPGGVRGDAAAVRRRLAARALPAGRRVDGQLHQPGQDGDQRRARRRPRDHPDPARRLPRLEQHDPALARVGPRPPAGLDARSSCWATRRSGRRTSSRSRSASSARSSSPATSPTGRMPMPVAVRPLRERSCTSSGCASTCAAR